MLQQIKHIIRSFKRSPFLVFVSMPGLIIGLTATLLLIFYIGYERSYDNHFANKERVVRLYNSHTEDNVTENYAICLREAYTEIPAQIPEIELATQIYRGGRNNIFYEKNQFNYQRVLYVDPEFFNVFGLNLLTGNKDDALKQKNSTVITQSLAKKIFGNSSCIGKVIIIGSNKFTVTGVINELPENTHFHFDLLTSLSTLNPDYFGGLEFFTYYLLRDKSDFKAANQKIPALNNKILKAHFSGFMENPKSGIEPLEKLHLHTIADFDLSEKADVKGMYILSFLAALILLIAVVNHINLFMLYGEKRSLEIGIRKSLGAGISGLVKQFYTETAIFTLIAFMLSFLLLFAVVPYFGQITGITIPKLAFITTTNILAIAFFMVLLIFITGSYPAIYLSKLDAISAIRGGAKTIFRKKWLAVLAVLVQFSISVFLIASLLVVNAQFSFLKNVPLGFNPENVIGISGFEKTISKKSESIKDELKKLPFVVSIGSSTHFMGGGCSGQMLYKYGESEERAKGINEYRVQAGFCKTFNLQLDEGRFFNGNGNDKSGIILNRAAVKAFGFKNPVGQSVVMFDDPMKIIGVVNDFYYNENAGESVAPLALTAYSNYVNVFYLRLKERLNEAQRKQLAAIFTAFDSNYNFDYFEVDRVYKNKFSNEDKLLKIIFYGTLIAVFLSFSGMFALSFFNVEQRTKEIGVRKVLGATSTEVLVKLLKDILKWVLWSMIPAFLVAYILLSNWLTEFTNRIEIGVIYFVLAAVVAVAIAVVAISIQSIKAARRNPVDSLRYE